MADYPQEPTSDEQLRNLQDQVRRLWTKMPKNVDWPWYSLRPYLCGGWLDPYSLNPDRSDDFDMTPQESGDRCGFFDTGQALIFTGLLLWNPSYNWTSPPYIDSGNPLRQGDPEVYRDATALVGRSDGFGNTTFLQDWDAGYPLPYEIGNFGYQLLCLPAISSDMTFFGSSTPWLNGAVYQIAVTHRTISFPLGAELVASTLVGIETNGAVIDPDGFTHHGPPDGDTLYSLNGLILRYQSKLPIPTGYPGAPRTADAFFGVDLS